MLVLSGDWTVAEFSLSDLSGDWAAVEFPLSVLSGDWLVFIFSLPVLSGDWTAVEFSLSDLSVDWTAVTLSSIGWLFDNEFVGNTLASFFDFSTLLIPWIDNVDSFSLLIVSRDEISLLLATLRIGEDSLDIFSELYSEIFFALS